MSQLKFTSRVVPLFLLLLCVLSYGLLIPWLGFYWDDWPVILIARLQDARGFWEFYRYDRPISAWTYILTAPLLGVRPLPWHVFTLLLRWITAVGVWWSLRRLWPGRERPIAWTAILFALYPSFLQQPIAVAFSQHWITYALYVFSLGLMIQAQQRRDRYLPLTLAALGLCALHLFTMEYFLGLELLRPAFLYVLVSRQSATLRDRWRRTLTAWLPYLTVAAAFIVWRAFFLELAGRDPNRLSLLASFVAQPLATLISLTQLALQDLLHLMVGAWSAAIDPAKLEITSSFFLLSSAIAVAGGLLTAGFASRLQTSEPEPENTGQTPAWERQAIPLGFAASVLGFLPVWLTERGAVEGMYGSRFTLAAVFGGSLLLAGLLEWFTPRLRQKIVLVSLLVVLSIHLHLNNANDYRWSWVSQQRFYRQLAWRAPYITPNTPILSDGELFPYVGVYSTSVALNLLYPQPAQAETLSYWFYSMGRGLYRQTEQLLAGMELQTNFRSFRFNAFSKDSLVIYYQSQEARCLWLLSPEDIELRELPELAHSVVPLSNLGRIQREPAAEGYPPEEIFGAEAESTWCYYFQKADLARQYMDWQTVVSLGEQARRQGFQAEHYREARPFIEAYAHIGDWQAAEEWTFFLPKVGPNVDAVCNLWKRLAQELPDDSDKSASLASVIERFSCPP